SGCSMRAALMPANPTGGSARVRAPLLPPSRSGTGSPPTATRPRRCWTGCASPADSRRGRKRAAPGVQAPPSHRLDDLLDHLLGVAEQHHRVVAVEQRVV